jgi:hypothetical protein
MRLDIACGKDKAEGFTGIDISGDADITHDLFTFPWPIDDGAVTEARCIHFVEHIPHWRPDYGTTDGWFWFWDEVYRITEPGARVTVQHPYLTTGRAFQDPTHTRFIPSETWAYLDANWRREQSLDHYPLVADFEVVTINGVGVAPDVQLRNHETQAFMRDRYWNVVADLEVILRRR